jgi:hypothetical protein
VCGTKYGKAVLASYEVVLPFFFLANLQSTLLIARNGQPPTIGEDLILPATKAITKKLFSEKHVNDLSHIVI